MAPQAVPAHTRILISKSTGLPGIPESQAPRRFVVEVMYRGDNDGTIGETPMADTALDRIVADIISGQTDHVIRVFELRDVSREIAGEVAAKLLEEGTAPHSDLDNFLSLYGFDLPRPAPDADELRERQFDNALWA